MEGPQIPSKFLQDYFKEDYLGIRVNLLDGELSVSEEGAMYFLS